MTIKIAVYLKNRMRQQSCLKLLLLSALVWNNLICFQVDGSRRLTIRQSTDANIMRCGSSWDQANKVCGQLCDLKKTCPENEDCYGKLSILPCEQGTGSVITDAIPVSPKRLPTSPYSMRCGKSWDHANSGCLANCNAVSNKPCETDKGYYCYGNLDPTFCKAQTVSDNLAATIIGSSPGGSPGIQPTPNPTPTSPVPPVTTPTNPSTPSLTSEAEVDEMLIQIIYITVPVSLVLLILIGYKVKRRRSSAHLPSRSKKSTDESSGICKGNERSYDSSDIDVNRADDQYVSAKQALENDISIGQSNTAEVNPNLDSAMKENANDMYANDETHEAKSALLSSRSPKPSRSQRSGDKAPIWARWRKSKDSTNALEATPDHELGNLTFSQNLTISEKDL